MIENRIKCICNPAPNGTARPPEESKTPPSWNVPPAPPAPDLRGADGLANTESLWWFLIVLAFVAGFIAGWRG